MDNSILKEISIEELKEYKGNICLYSTNFEDNLGDLIKAEFNDLFSSNALSYNISLATRTDASLILIDGDDFNPSKLGGLVKSYDVPIVVFIGNESKLNKLKDTLLKEPLIIDKNTCKRIDVKENVLFNLEEKRKRDEQKLLLEGSNKEEQIEQPNLNTESLVKEEPKEETNNNSSSKNFFFSDELETVEPIKSEEKVEKEVPIKEEKDSSTMFFFDEVEPNKNKEDNEIKEIEKLEEIKKEIVEEKVSEKDNNESFFKVNDLVETYDFSEEQNAYKKQLEEEKKKEKESCFFCDGRKLEKVGCYSNDLSIIDAMNKIFNQTDSIVYLDDKTKYDIVIIDITFALNERVFSFLSYQNCPAIIISKRSSKLHDFKEQNVSNVLYIEKPILVSPEIIKEDFREYLNHFDYKKNTQINVSRPTIDSGSSKANYAKKTTSPYRRPSIDSVKDEINRTNRRNDKALSLEEIYQKMGLNDISVFNSKINTAIFISDDNVVVKYTPAGYLIEYRIKRLESQGLPKEQINLMMKEFEEADIRFQKRILHDIETNQKVAQG